MGLLLVARVLCPCVWLVVGCVCLLVNRCCWVLVWFVSCGWCVSVSIVRVSCVCGCWVCLVWYVLYGLLCPCERCGVGVCMVCDAGVCVLCDVGFVSVCGACVWVLLVYRVGIVWLCVVLCVVCSCWRVVCMLCVWLCCVGLSAVVV